jgi:hypothetical protein
MIEPGPFPSADQLGEAGDGLQRRSQVVGGVGGETRQCAVVLGQPVNALFQLPGAIRAGRHTRYT